MRKATMFAAAVIAAAAVVSVWAAEPEFSAERMKAHVTFLADDLLEGREAGTPGHELAAHYIASQFALLGVKPGGQDGGYFQTVGMLEASLTGPKPTVTLTTPRGSQKLQQGVTAMLRGPTAGGAVKLRAPLLFVGASLNRISKCFCVLANPPVPCHEHDQRRWLT